jgi:hypothetical protein
VLSGLLISFTEDVDVPARLVGSVGCVVTLTVLAQRADLLHLLGKQLDLLEVVTDTRGGDRLGNNTVTTDLGPGKTIKLSDK